MPSTYSFSNSRLCDSSTVITPSLPTRSITSAMSWPISSSWAEIAATAAISSWLSMAMAISLIRLAMAEVPSSIPNLRSIGFAPAATFFNPSWTICWANTVAVVVPSPAISLVLIAACFNNWAPMFSKGSLSSISFATVTPS